MEKKRFPILDSIRGIVLVSMILYHATWNFVYIYGMKWSWYQSFAAYLWQQSICWTFILLSGFCFSLGKKHWKNGLLVSASGVLVTMVMEHSSGREDWGAARELPKRGVPSRFLA